MWYDDVKGIVEAEEEFRNLFGMKELKQAREKAKFSRKPYIQFLWEEKARKLREQHGDE